MNTKTNKKMERDTLPLIFKENKLLLKVKVAGLTVDFLVDSGANVSVLPYHIVKEAGLVERVKPLKATLNNPVAEYSPTIYGVLKEPLVCFNGLKLRPMLVVMSPAIPILGVEALSSYKCVLTCRRDKPFLRLRELQPSTPVSLLPTATYIPCTIMGFNMTALLDTGSTCCFMSCKKAEELGLKVSLVHSTGASTITGTLPILGYTSKADITFLGISTGASFCVNDVEDKVVIGLNVLINANMLLKFDAKALPIGVSAGY